MFCFDNWAERSARAVELKTNKIREINGFQKVFYHLESQNQFRKHVNNSKIFNFAIPENCLWFAELPKNTPC